MDQIIQYLFQTKALEVAKADQPFWYTSGDFGPYYINTHYLYGSKQMANELLQYIDEHKHKKEQIPILLFQKTKKQYQENRIYGDVIDYAVKTISQRIKTDSIDYVSGGERRDWFFSYMIAHLLDIPHITIYKDQTVVFSKNDEILEKVSLENKNILHVADLITSASSYVRAWIPAIENQRGKIDHSLSIVDRNQGGQQVLNDHRITNHSCVTFDEKMFQYASSQSIIDQNQYEMIMSFIRSPKRYMEEFLKKNKEFLNNSLKGDDKEKYRAKAYIKKNMNE